MFEIEVYGKWILAGEHAVLRGSPALVFPLKEKSLKLAYEKSSENLHVQFLGDSGREMELLFWGVVEKALDNLKRDRSDLRGNLVLNCSVPLGAGLGASATLCVALSRWLGSLGWVEQQSLYEFARTLENLFHGESSGVDIAVALSGEALKFQRPGLREKFTPAWQPKWYLSYSGKRGVTSECVAKVKTLWDLHPEQARRIDEDMKQAVRLAEQALLTSEEAGLDMLADSIQKARSCFDRWGLTSGEVSEQLSRLMSRGALAAKPTGSGDGGYILSLWDSAPSLSELRLIGV